MEVIPIEPPNAGSTCVGSRLVCLLLGDKIVTLTVEHQGFNHQIAGFRQFGTIFMMLV